MPDETSGGFRDDVDAVAEMDQRRARAAQMINKAPLFMLAVLEPDGATEIEMVGTVNDPQDIARLVEAINDALPSILAAAYPED